MSSNRRERKSARLKTMPCGRRSSGSAAGGLVSAGGGAETRAGDGLAKNRAEVGWAPEPGRAQLPPARLVQRLSICASWSGVTGFPR